MRLSILELNCFEWCGVRCAVTERADFKFVVMCLRRAPVLKTGHVNN